ncbi:M2 family metallopeptidase [Microbulbifer thermotolerans]|uniref:M2 family metallopeptidase n=1 Tax=Microbulbifer thermotolerans TaxID=252514 RepID=A0A143HNC5_MICTH|nr:M2 family metallopeptidase [Microbulbifer thermotolerans]AMX02986.1 peptidyl-dipeptidase [Microbulbifer thermotolerans]MCX2779915.1 M2 family metallopeptidase [Microbulbifer thermotolerans]MCX2781566.1 M2 family metallopeptidase [Microbulbifer thermotolerans]MCX2794724.1 M2 family metallopeptidase [Microbulbifer thermotolerans]MCX2802797.1 M2 family metallopeptidase [Microbulbifer thermotolerans]
MKKIALAIAATVALAGCQGEKADSVSGGDANKQLTAEDAKVFLQDAQSRLEAMAEEASRASWLAATYINGDSQFVEALASERYTAMAVELAAEAAKFNGLDLDPDTRRQLTMLKQGLVFPAPKDPALTAELAQIGSKMQGMYGAGKYCREEDGGEKCYTLTEMGRLMAESRDPELLEELWVGWREISPPMKPLYERQVEIGNAGAQELGYDNLSVFWRSKYDMEPDAFSADMDAQWNKVKPLYEALHCHVRAKLNEHYGDEVVPSTGKIPAHLLGNMWAQEWGNIYDLVKDEDMQAPYDLTQLVVDSGMSEKDMVKVGENFFTSLGFKPLPQSFWETSQFTQPRDRDVVCHASAWNMDGQDDIRIKMCIQKTGEDFVTIHHELGHNFYQRIYKHQPFLYKEGANDGFHEAIGDTIALSITPKYLKQIGLMDEIPDESKDIGFLMQQALDKIAFLPFGLLVDKWRWQVFNGEVKPEDYNKAWWKLREQYQGIQAPVERTEANFDPGAKYHIPGNTPYARYFLARIQQFQFHRALCEAAGETGPLHRCSIYKNDAAGKKLRDMLAMGASKPWPDAMEALTGQRELDASAIIDYFQPLMAYLEEQNKGRQCGWE